MSRPFKTTSAAALSRQAVEAERRMTAAVDAEVRRLESLGYTVERMQDEIVVTGGPDGRDVG